MVLKRILNRIWEWRVFVVSVLFVTVFRESIVRRLQVASCESCLFWFNYRMYIFRRKTIETALVILVSDIKYSRHEHLNCAGWKNGTKHAHMILLVFNLEKKVIYRARIGHASYSCLINIHRDINSVPKVMF